ncbi:MAG: hypothetical protein M1825_003664 [Sarcosagium campestre]|nr:MAG: hypothetical protein M1825_003664 [Sarcosagium campestre]
MAIYPKLAAQQGHQHPHPPPSQAEIEAWTASVTETLQNLNVSSQQPNAAVLGGPIPLSIPLDELPPPPRASEPGAQASAPHTRRKEPLRRDSQKRREALLKGKEGSRRRQRWENDRLLNNPYAQPPLPSDWEVHPTYPRHATVPYYLAPLWDAGLKHRRAVSQKEKLAAREEDQAKNPGANRVPKELRQTLKRARASRGLLRDLETEVRAFVERWESSQANAAAVDSAPAPAPAAAASPTASTDDSSSLSDFLMASDDEEIVFVGRNGKMKDVRIRSGGDPGHHHHHHHQQQVKQKTSDEEEQKLQREKLVFDSLADDHGASFGYEPTQAAGLSTPLPGTTVYHPGL